MYYRKKGKGLRKIIIFMTLFFIATNCKSTDRGQVTLLTGEYMTPYVFNDAHNNFRGINVEIVSAILNRMGVEFELIQVPRERANLLIKANRADGLLTTLPFEQKKLSNYWFSDELYLSRTSLIIRKQDHFKLNHFTSNEKLVLASVRGGPLSNFRPDAVMVNSPLNLFSLLDMERVDGVMSDEILFYSIVRTKNLMGRVKIAENISEKVVRLAISYESPWVNKFKNNFNSHLKIAKDEEIVDKIFIKHLSL